MNESPEEDIKFQISSLIESVNVKSKPLLNHQFSPIIIPTSLEKYRMVPPELGFIRTIAWLYVLYFEDSKENFIFLSEKFSTYQIDTEAKTNRHKISINCLRTSFQHNLFSDSSHNKIIRSNCNIWYQNQCGFSSPETDEDWHNCLLSVLNEAHFFFKCLDECIDKISKDKEYLSIIITDWETRLTQNHPPHEFDRIIESAAMDMGRENLDPVKFRLQFYNSWISELRLLKKYNFETEVRKLVERDLLQNFKPVLPFNGNDIIDYFGIPPGKKVKELLELGHSILKIGSYPKEEFLKLLNEEAKKGGIL